MKEIVEQELPYQTLCVVLALELLTLAALSPRIGGLEPLGYHAIGSLRLIGLLVLGALLHQAKPKEALIALALWAIILAPPEIWAFALEAREGLPLGVASSFLAATGAYAFARLFPSASQIYVLLGVMALFLGGFQPSLYSVPLLVLLSSSMLLVAIVLYVKPQGENQ